MFTRKPRVGDNVRYLQQLGLLPVNTDQFLYSIRDKGKLIFVGVDSGVALKPNWVAGFTVNKPVNENFNNFEEIANLKLKQTFFLSPRGKGTIEQQVENVRIQLKQFLEVNQITDVHLQRFSEMLRVLEIDADSYLWNVDVYEFLNRQDQSMAATKRHVLSSVLFSDIEDVKRLTSLTLAGVPLFFINQMWDLPYEWIIKASNPEALTITGPKEKIFMNLMKDVQPKR